MALDEFKTQVMLLHSEQSTLDDLRSGFSDRYTVHCATSGIEALNTLADTPINVIISAHDLPGMSGLDALREAKKRSPNTIGFLLAGTKTTDIEALVGEEEVFQVVSGTVTGAGLLALVDDATRHMQLMTLADSANDTSANLDEPAEHIIMETSENGSTIISDGTGKLPILDPKKISAAANVGSSAVDVLVLTKDLEFLGTIQESARGMHKVFYANTLDQANEAIRKNRIGVAVVDSALVGEKLEQLAMHLRKGSPRLVCIVAGHRDDGDMLMDLIGRGKVYRFLLKPVSPGRARLAVESSVKHHLEAPDGAFEAKGIPDSGKPAAGKPTARRAATAASKPSRTATRAAAPAPADPPLGSDSVSNGGSPIDDGPANASGDSKSKFTETDTGLISSVDRKFSSETKSDSTPASGSGGSLFRSATVIGIAATAIIVVGGGLYGYWVLSGTDGEPVQTDEKLSEPTTVAAEATPKAEPPVADTAGVSALVDEARLAREAGRIFSPDGRNAIDLFAEAMTLDPDNSLIVIELDAAIGQALSLAETAMLESRVDETSAALQRVRAVDPQNSRLPFLTAQLSQMRLRTELDSARAAIREERFEDAGIALGAARGLNIADETEIDTLDAELTAARSEQQVDDVLAKAATRLNSGDLLSPSNDNARYYYQLVLTNDPDHSAARQGLSIIAGKLAFQARNEIDSGELSLASDTLTKARALDPANSEVAGATIALETMQIEIAAQQAEAERLAQEQASSEAHEAATIEPADTPIRLEMISVSELTRTKYAAPKYPRAAQRRKLSGWVDVVFTVTRNGTVKDVDVRESEPGETFDSAAIKAIEKWEFKPVIENGRIVEKRAGVRLMFALE